MKRRIDQLLNEKFEYEAPQLVIEPSQLSGRVRAGENWRGSFSVENPAGRKMKGVLYASGPRAGLAPESFHSTAERISFEIDTRGMEAGDTAEGVFTLCSDLGEYQIPYQVQVERPGVRTEPGEIPDLPHFTALAKKDYQKAYQLFLSSEFTGMLKKNAPELETLYDGLMAQTVSCRSMEEFLIAAGQKEAVRMELDRSGAEFRDLSQSVQESVQLTKSSWGFFRLDVTSDAPFLWVEKPIVTPDDFIGSTYTLRYLVDPTRMHGGKNYGRITIKGQGVSLTVAVTARRAENSGRSLLSVKRKRQLKTLEEAYVDFRTKRIDRNAWIAQSHQAIEGYRAAEGKDAFVDLAEVQLAFAEGKEDAACLLLENLEQHRERLNSAELRGYYLYLTTFYHKGNPQKDKLYVDDVENTLSEMFRRRPESWQLQWLLLYLEEKMLRHPAEKLSAIRQQYLYGCHSRIMYLEAAQVLERSPLLLRQLEAFEIQILHFMCRQDMLNGELVMQLTELAGRAREYREILFQILCECYEKYPSRGLITAICSLLIKGRKTGAAYFPWYEKGVLEDSRLTGLFEYYIASMPQDHTGSLPQKVRMYFSCNHTLSGQKKAEVYVNVVRNQEIDRNTYLSYRPAMERFLVEQLEEGRISRENALLYKAFLTPQLLNARLAENLTRVLFTWEITCREPGAKTVIVRHGQLAEEQKLSLTDGKACVQLYTSDCRIFIGDENGRRYAASMVWSKERLLEDPLLLETCKKLAPDSLPLILSELDTKRQEQTDEAKIAVYRRMLALPGIRPAYREQLLGEILDYCYENPGEEAGDFLRETGPEKLVRLDKKKTVELCTEIGMYQEAFALVSRYGAESIELSALVRLCSRMILNTEFEENEMLLAQCAFLLEQKKYDETILAYLLAFYEGPPDRMKLLWQAGHDFGLETYRLEECILWMLLFTRSKTEQTEKIFESYAKAAGKRKLLHAYAILMCYESFVRQREVGEEVFAWVERGYERGRVREEICKLALLDFYAKQKELKGRRSVLAEELLEDFLGRGIVFGFFKKLAPQLRRAFLLFDKSFVEYRTNPAATVTLSYHIEDADGSVSREYHEILNPLFEGIYVREFTLFHGEKLLYSFHEECGGQTKDTPERPLLPDEDPELFGESRFGMVNRLARNLEKGLPSDELIRTYLEKEKLSEGLFTLN